MNHDEYCCRMRDVKYTAGMNARYHQNCEDWFDWWDKAIRVAVAGLAVFGLVLAVPGLDKDWPGANIPWWGLVVAILSMVAAVALNVIPVVEKAKFHGEMFRAWSELRKEAVLEEHKTCDGSKDHHIDRLAELISKMESLNAREPFPDSELLEKCQEDENEAEWGKGIRTEQQVEEERRKRQPPTSPSAAASV